MALLLGLTFSSAGEVSAASPSLELSPSTPGPCRGAASVRSRLLLLPLILLTEPYMASSVVMLLWLSSLWHRQLLHWRRKVF